ncbi:TadE/TadG family type IV pilus assembly protein [Phycicoccus sp. Root563]|uniref:TadE/TadG family type IV pilus assembly protein n=1 Tax=Phycicoccus sp. Root563 TaxID=1736562 RepID=UPI0012F92479|nr:TadE/TadG family type IV pilus assembly protein [Phycicoccus sp. Root563]
MSRRRRSAGERGAVAMMVALLAIPVSILAGLTIDFGMTFAKRQALASGADSGALAITNQLRQMVLANLSTYPTCASVLATDPTSTTAKSTAVNFINRNSQYGESVPASQVSANLSCQGNYLVADVTVDTSVPTALGGLVGVNSLRANRSAQSVLKLSTKADCGLCILGNNNHDIQNGNVVINAGNVAFNGNAGSGPNGEVNVTTSGGTTSIEGTWLYPSKGDWTPQPLQGQPTMDDPLADLPMPPSMAGLTKKTNICSDGPGIYTSLAPNTSPCNIGGGMYVITGGTHYSGQTDLVATGATLYFTCADASGMPRECAAGEGAGADFTGQATLGVSAPTTTVNSGVPKIAILADRNYSGTLSFRGNPVGGITGTIYTVGATLDIRGNGDTTTLTSLLVVKDLTFSGNNATLNITYDGVFNQPPTPVSTRLTR